MAAVGVVGTHVRGLVKPSIGLRIWLSSSCAGFSDVWVAGCAREAGLVAGSSAACIAKLSRRRIHRDNTCPPKTRARASQIPIWSGSFTAGTLASSTREGES